MSHYAPVSPQVDGIVFDSGERVPADDLTFKDFGTPNGASSGRVSPVGGGLYDADVAMQRQVGSSGFFSVDYYSRWFDVDTMLVFDRAWRTMYPLEDFIDTVLNGAPDLYGPFWLPTTLIFALFFSSSLSSSITAYLAGKPYSYDFTRLPLAVSVVYSYAFAIPAGFWAVMRYWAGVEGRSLVDIIAIFGYGMTIWIPVALLSIPPLPFVRLAFTILAFVVSLGFLLRNLYPALATSPQKAARGLVIAVGLIQLTLVFILYLSFLGVSHRSIGSNSPIEFEPEPEPIGDNLRWR